MEQLITETISRNMKDNRLIENSQQVFTKWKPLTNQIALYDEAAMKDEVRAVDIAYFIFRKVFDSVSCKILIQKLMKYGWMNRRQGGLKTGCLSEPRVGDQGHSV